MNWEDADSSDKILLRALSLLYSKNENLLHLLLNPDIPRLNSSARNIKKYSLALSSGEELLVRIGLDIWDGGSGGIFFNEMYEKLDAANFQKVMLVLHYLYSPNEAINF